MTEAALQSGSMRSAISDETADRRFARVSLASELGTAASNVYGLDLPPFIAEVERLSRTLTGSASLEGIEGDFRLSLNAGKLGHVKIEARLSDIERSSDFYASGQTDQTHLPDFIRACRALELEDELS